jgi:SAM-dependent methyltransferase
MPFTVADLYDAIYFHTGKDYDGEVRAIRTLIEQHSPRARTLLDVGCGTGQHLARLRQQLRVEGADLDAGVQEHARARLGEDVPLHLADMVDLDLGRRFDVVTSLFSAIGYVRTVPRLRQAVKALASHLEPGGLLIVEPWFHPETWKGEVGVYASFVDEPGWKIARLGVNRRRGRMTTLHHRFLVATADGFQNLREKLVLRLFTDAEYRRAFELAGLRVEHDPKGITGRGTYVGIAPSAIA